MSDKTTIRLTQVRRDAIQKFIELYEETEGKELYQNSTALFEAVRLATRYLQLKKRKRHIIKKQFKEDFEEEI